MKRRTLLVINTSDTTNNKTFWKTVKPFFTDKIKTKSKITLIEKKLSWNHPSIIILKNKKKIDQRCFEKVKTLDATKASQQSDIPTKILKENSDYFAEYFYENINQCMSKSIFPLDLKLADVIPVYKKKSKISKDNYRPVSILSNISKIYERCIYDQIQLFFDSLLSKYLYGFRRGHNAQHSLISLIEKWRKSVDNGGAFGALLTDLSKAFDCLPHELLLSKLDAYGFDKSSLKLIRSYLSNGKQRVNDRYDLWSEILFGVPQGSILGLFLFNIFI